LNRKERPNQRANGHGVERDKQLPVNENKRHSKAIDREILSSEKGEGRKGENGAAARFQENRIIKSAEEKEKIWRESDHTCVGTSRGNNNTPTQKTKPQQRSKKGPATIRTLGTLLWGGGGKKGVGRKKKGGGKRKGERRTCHLWGKGPKLKKTNRKDADQRTATPGRTDREEGRK